MSLAVRAFRPSQARIGVLVLEPGEGGGVGTPLRYIRIVNLTLPQNQLPESIMANQIPLFARSFVHGKPRGINLYEVDPKTVGGSHMARYVRCTSDGCYGSDRVRLLWPPLDGHKPYIVYGESKP